MNNRGTSLLELLLIIVIIALLLKVSIPKIIGTKEVNDTINNVVEEVNDNPTTDDNTNESGINAVKIAGIRDSAIIIAKLAEDNYSTQILLGNDKNIECSDIARISDDYEYCKVDYDENGVAKIELKGKPNGRFSNIICNGTKDNMNCTK